MKISRQQLVVGMELAASVEDHQGRQLLSAGTVLTAREISAFEFWGIATVDVIEAELSSEFPQAAPISAEEEARVQKRFKHLSLTHPVGKILLAESLARAARRSGEGLDANDTRRPDHG